MGGEFGLLGKASNFINKGRVVVFAVSRAREMPEGILGRYNFEYTWSRVLVHMLDRRPNIA